MKITIEIDGAAAHTVAGADISAPATTAPSHPGAPSAAGSSLSDLLAKGAATGALNAGPAPSLSSVTMGPAPVTFSLGGGSSEASMITTSAGAPPPHVYGSKGGCQ
jgi:hypothetical protein